VARCNLKRNPFHPFSCFDTATLAGVAVGQTVLSRAMEAAGLEWEKQPRPLRGLRCGTYRSAVLHDRQPFRPLYEQALSNEDRPEPSDI
jgi:ribonuclease T